MGELTSGVAYTTTLEPSWNGRRRGWASSRSRRRRRGWASAGCGGGTRGWESWAGAGGWNIVGEAKEFDGVFGFDGKDVGIDS